MASSSYPNVSFIRPELAQLMPQYALIRDVLEGETKIKSCTKQYLPMPSPEDDSIENKARYKAYLLRAVFYNVTRRTLSGLIGQVFMRDPILKIPSQMEIIKNDCTGTGVTLFQQAKKALNLNLAYSRGGVFIDYPDVQAGATVADLEAGNVRPTITVYSPMEIINWRVIDVGAKELLSLVVLAENYCISDDGFEMKHAHQFRVLRLDDNLNYVVEIWREETPTNYNAEVIKKGRFKMWDQFIPLDASGSPFKEIPFSFFGSQNNDTLPDNPNMYDLASINIAHYRNSADYEEACYIVGQPTPVVIGVTEEWNEKVLKGSINFGSRGVIPLPVGGDAKLLQAAENTMIKEAMEIKERQMVALGAKLVEQNQVQRTAFETKVEATSEGSILSDCAKNISQVFVFALKWCCRFMGLNEDGIEFELNTDFDISKMSPEEQSQAMKNWQSGGLTFEEFRNTLRKAGQATEPDEQAKAKIQTEMAASLALQMPDNTPATPANSYNKGGNK